MSKFISSINSYLGILGHYSSYNIRKKAINKWLSEEWRKVIDVDDNYLKVSPKEGFRPSDRISKVINGTDNPI